MTECSTPGCARRASARGLCNTCYGRAWRKGEHRKHEARKHFLSEVLEPGRGVCVACGETELKPGRGTGWLCVNAAGRDGSSKVYRTEYGLLPEERLALIERYGECAICGVTEGLVVDHCHETMVIRGVLCGSCNVGLGMFKDDQIRLRRSIKYLDAPPINRPAERLAI